jgi:putative membrane protein
MQLTKGEKLAVDRTDLAADRTRLANDRTHLAYNRTFLALEGVMMGWIKTSMALITFGFTIYKFFQLELRSGAPSPYLIGAREYGLAMVVIGLVSLLVATWEYRTNTMRLRAKCTNLPRSMAGVVAALVGVLGGIAFIVMLLRQ